MQTQLVFICMQLQFHISKLRELILRFIKNPFILNVRGNSLPDNTPKKFWASEWLCYKKCIWNTCSDQIWGVSEWNLLSRVWCSGIFADDSKDFPVWAKMLSDIKHESSTSITAYCGAWLTWLLILCRYFNWETCLHQLSTVFKLMFSIYFLVMKQIEIILKHLIVFWHVILHTEIFNALPFYLKSA